MPSGTALSVQSNMSPAGIVGVIGGSPATTQQVQALRVHTPLGSRLAVPLPQSSQLIATQPSSAVVSRLVQPASAAPSLSTSPGNIVLYLVLGGAFVANENCVGCSGQLSRHLATHSTKLYHYINSTLSSVTIKKR